MSGSIGGYSFFDVWREQPSNKVEVVLIRAAGEDGTPTMDRGTHSKSTRIVAISRAPSASQLKTNYTTYQGLVGSRVSVTDTFGNTYTNLEIINVEEMSAVTMTNSTDNATHEQTFEFFVVDKN